MALTHGVLALSYAALAMLIISPAFIFTPLSNPSNRRTAILIALLALLVNSIFEVIQYTPMRPMLTALLDVTSLRIVSILSSNFLLILATLFVYVLAKHVLAHWQDRAYLFLVSSLLCLLGHTILITHNFSSSYVAMSLPLFVLLGIWHKEWRFIDFVANSTGIILGASLLAFNLGLPR